MGKASIHRWDVGYPEAVAIQERLRGRLILRDEGLADPLRSVAGADISYDRGSDLFFAAVVVLGYPGLEPLEETTHAARVLFPYIPGLLSFREGPPLLGAFAKLRQRPDLILFDGQGIAHPRGIGLASHLGLLLDRSAIGCAKSRLAGTHGTVGDKRGDWTALMNGKDRIGAVVRTRPGVKPVFVSPGHRISLESAVAITLACCRGYRLPEPVRRAHRAVNALRTAASPRQRSSGG